MRGPCQASIVIDFAAPAAVPLVMSAITSGATVWVGWDVSQAVGIGAAQLPSNGR